MNVMRVLLAFWLSILLLPLYGGQVEERQIYSSTLEREVGVVVVLPDSYYNNEGKYPVLYLLHGAEGSYRNWIERAPFLQDLVDKHQMVVVCPDGGKYGWYLDSPIDPKSQYESFMIGDLLPWVDRSYRSIADRSGRAITGLSMGGHGALYLTFRHPDLFGAAGSMSGGVDLRGYPNSWELPKRLGSQAKYPEHWEAHTVINLVELINPGEVRLLIDCGYDDFFFKDNEAFHAKLLQHQIEHDYIVRPGKHDWDYWRNAIRYHMLFFELYFREQRSTL